MEALLPRDTSEFVSNMPILWNTQQLAIEEELAAGYSMPNLLVYHHTAKTDNLCSAFDLVPDYYFDTDMANDQQQQLINNGDDDGNISIILSDSYRRNIKSFNNNLSSVSSGDESHKNKDKDDVVQCHVNETEDTISKRTSSLQGNISEHNKANHAKRSFKLISENHNNAAKPKRTRWDDHNLSSSSSSSSNINFQQPNSSISFNSSISHEPDQEAIAQMKEMIYRAAAFRPVNLGLEVVEKPRRKNVRISSDPQTVAARQRRERISERIRVLQKIVPGGSKMDTASTLDEAANYLKFLRSQVKALENLGDKVHYYSMNCSSTPFSFTNPSHHYYNFQQYHSTR
ncbi:hypothetical protein K1719_047267 [Acacia pycnantha]|nr:hypothetical protein K1719_047267 [Acacia pycnantha]